jgi:hypothetical protein
MTNGEDDFIQPEEGKGTHFEERLRKRNNLASSWR